MEYILDEAEDNSQTQPALLVPTIGFRVQRKSFFLTYPQSGNLTREEVLRHLQTVGTVDACSIGLETHQDGTPHIHVTVQFTAKINSRNPRIFDVGNHHPHISPSGIKSWKESVDYTEKEDDNPLRFGRVDELVGAGTEKKRKRNDVMDEILRESSGRQDFLKRLREAEPWEFVKFNSSFESFADRNFPEPAPSFVIPEGYKFNPVPPMDQWVAENLIGPHPVCLSFCLLTFGLFLIP